MRGRGNADIAAATAEGAMAFYVGERKFPWLHRALWVRDLDALGHQYRAWCISIALLGSRISRVVHSAPCRLSGVRPVVSLRQRDTCDARAKIVADAAAEVTRTREPLDTSGWFFIYPRRSPPGIHSEISSRGSVVAPRRGTMLGCTK